MSQDIKQNQSGRRNGEMKHVFGSDICVPKIISKTRHREEDGRDVNHHGRDADLVSRKENVQVEVKFSDQAVRTGLILSSGPQEEVQGGCRQEVKQKTVESFEVLQLLYHPNYFDHFFPWLLCGRLSAFNLMCPCLINK